VNKKNTEVQEFRSSEVQEFRSSEVQDSPESWTTGVLATYHGAGVTIPISYQIRVLDPLFQQPA
jgi:hypothetical protein